MTCRDCNKPAVLYWVKKDVWPFPYGQVQELCPDCLEKVIDRKLNLNDLEIEYYLKSTAHNSKEFIRDYVQATVIGALIPPGWSLRADRPFSDGSEVGAKLARQAPDVAAAVLPKLIADVNRIFPA